MNGLTSRMVSSIVGHAVLGQAMAFSCALFLRSESPRHLDAMGDDAVEDDIGESWVADQVVPAVLGW